MRFGQIGVALADSDAASGDAAIGFEAATIIQLSASCVGLRLGGGKQERVVVVGSVSLLESLLARPDVQSSVATGGASATEAPLEDAT